MATKRLFQLASLVAVLSGLLLTLTAAVIPAVARPSAVVFGIGLALLGYSLFVKRETKA
jgi:hypothetical protein